LVTEAQDVINMGKKERQAYLKAVLIAVKRHRLAVALQIRTRGLEVAESRTLLAGRLAKNGTN
jgi:hypothetical protein